MKEYPKLKCGTCGNDTPFDDYPRRQNRELARCTNCYEVETRLERYLQRGGAKAERFIRYTIEHCNNTGINGVPVSGGDLWEDPTP